MSLLLKLSNATSQSAVQLKVAPLLVRAYTMGEQSLTKQQYVNPKNCLNWKE